MSAEALERLKVARDSMPRDAVSVTQAAGGVQRQSPRLIGVNAGDLAAVAAGVDDPIAANLAKGAAGDPTRSVAIQITDLYHLLEKADGGSTPSRSSAPGEPAKVPGRGRRDVPPGEPGS